MLLTTDMPELAYAQTRCPRCGIVRWARAGAADCGSVLCGILPAPRCNPMDDPVFVSMDDLEYQYGDQ